MMMDDDECWIMGMDDQCECAFFVMVSMLILTWCVVSGGASSGSSSGSSGGASGSVKAFSSAPGFLSRAQSDSLVYATWFALLAASFRHRALPRPPRPADLSAAYDVYLRIKVEQLHTDESV